ncbi:helix-turn-helix domain-containing protein [uncultured Abiotrophia sp.]|uniref:helix-turn-helix domain-containing protein n=1 Tax=uncultured Abiotrophia sp. TaxID=316094 RepID=UPI0028D7A655|nr:helix-turn-helix domain-containing protein [uncultured Abiotrophia sp.]
MEESAERFIKIPDTVKRMKGLSDGAKLLYGELLALTHAKGYCFATNQYLADALGSSLTAIHRRLKELEIIGLVRRDVSSKGGRGPRKIYVNTSKANYPKVDTQVSEIGDLSIRNRNAKYPKSAPIIDNIIDKPIDNIINNPSTPYREVIQSEELLPNTIPLRDEKPIVTTMQDIEQADRDYLKKQQQIMSSQLNIYREKGIAQ